MQQVGGNVRSRRGILIAALVVFGIWALMMSDIQLCSSPAAGASAAVVETGGPEGRGQIMLAAGLAGLRDLNGIAYMYMTGNVWTLGSYANPGRHTWRVIVGCSDDNPEYEGRSVDGETWWRIRCGDGWQAGSHWRRVYRSMQRLLQLMQQG